MARFVRSPNVVARRIAGELVLVPIASRTENPVKRTANFYVLNATAESLWDQMQAPADLPSLVGRLVRDYAVDADTATRDVEQFVAELSACGAIDSMEQT
jgi:hypothetical protein